MAAYGSSGTGSLRPPENGIILRFRKIVLIVPQTGESCFRIVENRCGIRSPHRPEGLFVHSGKISGEGGIRRQRGIISIFY